MWIDTFGAYPAGAPPPPGAQQALRRPPEQHVRDLVDAAQRDHHERDEQEHAEREREGRAKDEIVVVPILEHGCGPGADPMGRHGEQQRLRHRRAGHGQDRQRHQHPDGDRDGADLPALAVGDRAGPGEFQVAVAVEQTPIGADAAFGDLPGLIEGLDDVVVYAERLGARQERADDARLLELAGDSSSGDCSRRSASRTPQ